MTGRSPNRRSCLLSGKVSSTKHNSRIKIQAKEKIRGSPNTQSNNYPSTTLISGVQEVSEDMWLHILIGHLIQTRLLEKSFFTNIRTTVCRLPGRGLLFSRNNTYLYFLIYLNLSMILRTNKTRKLTRRRIRKFSLHNV